MLATVEGIYREGKIELDEIPTNLLDNARVIVTFFSKRSVDLQTYPIGAAEAAELRAQLMSFTEEWDSPEMDIYDEYDRVKADL